MPTKNLDLNNLFRYYRSSPVVLPTHTMPWLLITQSESDSLKVEDDSLKVENESLKVENDSLKVDNSKKIKEKSDSETESQGEKCDIEKEILSSDEFMFDEEGDEFLLRVSEQI